MQHSPIPHICAVMVARLMQIFKTGGKTYQAARQGRSGVIIFSKIYVIVPHMECGILNGLFTVKF